MLIKFINGVLARQENKEGTDTSLASLVAGTYKLVVPEQNRCLKVRKDNGINIFLSIDKLDSHLKSGDIDCV